MQGIISVAITAVAAIVIYLLGRASGRQGSSPRLGKAIPAGAPAPSPAEGELVAVIAAAVSAASGMELGSFRLTGIQPSAASLSRGGFNTPVWGHIDRFNRGE
jgi:hypothetical protein